MAYATTLYIVSNLLLPLLSFSFRSDDFDINLPAS